MSNKMYMVFAARKYYPGCARLIPRSKSHSIEEGIQFKIKDPLRILSMSYQLGNFTARNGGEIVRAEIDTETSYIDSINYISIIPRGTIYSIT